MTAKRLCDDTIKIAVGGQKGTSTHTCEAKADGHEGDPVPGGAIPTMTLKRNGEVVGHFFRVRAWSREPVLPSRGLPGLPPGLCWARTGTWKRTRPASAARWQLLSPRRDLIPPFAALGAAVPVCRPALPGAQHQRCPPGHWRSWTKRPSVTARRGPASWRGRRSCTSNRKRAPQSTSRRYGLPERPHRSNG